MKRIMVTAAIAICLLLSWAITISHASEMTKEEILTILKELDYAVRIHDVDLIMSYYAEDVILDGPPYPPYGKEEEREFMNYFFEAYPTFSIANNNYLASGPEKVGIAEHSSIYVVNGVPIDVPHICAMDFDEGKTKIFIVYLDYAAELIQTGAMPPHKVGNMIPSFPLPASEPTGLTSMEASAELAARMNSHDLSSVAKMMRNDVDVWFPFIDRTAIRSEFIGIHEQMLGGFSDMSWENVRRIDMDDGWVYSEVILKGTNDGEFLGKPATGLPMEVRAGLIEHYDESGLATYVHFHFDTLSVPGQAMPVDEVKEQMLEIMYLYEEAWRNHDLDQLFSFYMDDAVFDFPPFPPPMNKEETRAFCEDYLLTYPTFYIPEGFHKVSVKDGVGFMEHTDITVTNGIAMENFHICLLDFEGLKIKKFTNYSDWGTDLIQAGAMPPRNLGDLVPSFPLPEPEGTGMSPIEASAELLKRLNAHDLSSVAKMLRKDVDAWFPFIERTAIRSEFIGIHEQMLSGFSDMSWENTRRVDMEDGWVFSEVTLRGTNDGEFLDKAATGLPMEVRSGLIEHYDENGLATYVHFHFDTLSVPGQEAPTGPVEDFSNVFFVDLTPGLNMVSLPLKPQTPYTARSLAEEIGATVVIQYDEASGRFVGYTSGSPGDGFPIEGGKGYIVNVLEGKTHTFTGAVWTNEPSSEAAPPAGSNPSGWAFIVSVAMTDHKGDEYTMTVRNLRTGAVATDSIADGRFHAVFADLDRNTVIEAGDKVEIVIRDSSSKIVAGPVTYQIGQEDIRKAFRDILIPYGYARPEKSLLLQNYPNPFNPETWIPFHLAQDADVSVRIYDASGKLIRSLAPGHSEAGVYVEKDKAVYWDGKSDSGEEVASGIYFYSINAGGFSATRKMIVKR